MKQYPKVNYIGNKEKIAECIIENIPIKKGKILDLFSSGCSLSYAFKKANFSVISNDILYSNFCISKAIIENSNNIFKINITPSDLQNFYTKKSYANISWLTISLRLVFFGYSTS